MNPENKSSSTKYTKPRLREVSPTLDPGFPEAVSFREASICYNKLPGCPRQPDNYRKPDGILKEDITCLSKKWIFPSCSML